MVGTHRHTHTVYTHASLLVSYCVSDRHTWPVDWHEGKLSGWVSSSVYCPGNCEILRWVSANTIKTKKQRCQTHQSPEEEMVKNINPQRNRNYDTTEKKKKEITKMTPVWFAALLNLTRSFVRAGYSHLSSGRRCVFYCTVHNVPGTSTCHDVDQLTPHWASSVFVDLTFH